MLWVENGSNDERIELGRTEDRGRYGVDVAALVGGPGDCSAAACDVSVFRYGPQPARVGRIRPGSGSRPGRFARPASFVLTGSSLYGMTIS